MKNTTATLLSVCILVAGPSAAAEHLVPLESAEARLAEAAADRERDLAALDALLTTPAGRRAASTAAVDLDRVRSGLAALSDPEMRDLARRAAALDTDPVAGLDSDMRQILIVLLVVLIVILVFDAVD